MKKIIAIFLSGMIVVSGTLPVAAQSTYCGLNAINIAVNGTAVANIGDTYSLEDGSQVPFSILYEGTTYVPMRKLAEMLGNTVTWDQTTRTATITSSEKSAALDTAKNQGKEGTLDTIDASWNYVNIVVDGNQIAKDGESYTLDNGNSVPFSLLYNGTTYLPLRKISEVLYKDVDYVSTSKTAAIKEAAVLPILGYDKVSDIPDFGALYDTKCTSSGIVNNVMAYHYDFTDKTSDNINLYKIKLAKAGFDEVDNQQKSGDDFSQDYWTYYNSIKGEIVGIVITTVKATGSKNLSILIGRDNPAYKANLAD